MHEPDGTDYPNHIEWREIVPPERLVYLQRESAKDPSRFEATVTLLELGNATEVTPRAVFPSSNGGTRWRSATAPWKEQSKPSDGSRSTSPRWP